LWDVWHDDRWFAPVLEKFGESLSISNLKVDDTSIQNGIEILSSFIHIHASDAEIDKINSNLTKAFVQLDEFKRKDFGSAFAKNFLTKIFDRVNIIVVTADSLSYPF
jgi:hypothetical protein